MTVGKKKTSRELRVTTIAMSNGYLPGKKTLAVGSYRWAVLREGGQWQFLNLKIYEFFREGLEALRMMVGVDTVIIRGNGNVVVGQSEAV